MCGTDPFAFWEDAQLSNRRKGDGAKVRIAQRLRSETTVTLAWIAQRLKMGTAGHVANRLYEANRSAQRQFV